MPTIKYQWTTENPPKPDVYLTRYGQTKHQVPRYWDGEKWYALQCVAPGNDLHKPRIVWNSTSYHPQARRKSWEKHYEYVRRAIPPKTGYVMQWGQKRKSYTTTELFNQAVRMGLLNGAFLHDVESMLNGKEVPNYHPLPSSEDSTQALLKLVSSNPANISHQDWAKLVALAPANLIQPPSDPQHVQKGDRRLVNNMWMVCTDPSANAWEIAEPNILRGDEQPAADSPAPTPDAQEQLG